jgi:hypothetical protein
MRPRSASAKRLAGEELHSRTVPAYLKRVVNGFSELGNEAADLVSRYVIRSCRLA